MREPCAEDKETVVRFPPIADIRRFLQSGGVASPKHILSFLAALIALGACRQALPSNDAVAARIERKVLSRHPDVHLERYARFYAHGPNASVQAVYVHANVGYEPIVGRSGETVWTTPDALPVIYDGGCSVLVIEYDAAADALQSFRCS